MPFTFSHPAAVIPLDSFLGRFGVLSALVIGSISPDLALFIPLGITRSESHSLIALLWFCLPVGLLSYGVFHSFLKGPLLALLPVAIFRKLGNHALRYNLLPVVPWYAVVVSLLIGAFTHVVWDAFTHSNTAVVAALPFLETHLFAVGSYQVYVYKLLQHLSTGIGLMLVARWCWRWLMNPPALEAPLPFMLTGLQRYAVLLTIIGGATVVGIWAGTRHLDGLSGTTAMQSFIGNAVFATIPAAGALVLIYCAGWHMMVEDIEIAAASSEEG